MGFLQEIAPDRRGNKTDLDYERRIKHLYREADDAVQKRRQRINVTMDLDTPNELKRLDELQRMLGDKMIRRGGNVANQRTMAKLRLKARDDWKPKVPEFKFDTYAGKTTSKNPTLVSLAEQIELSRQANLIDIRNGRCRNLKRELRDADSVHKYIEEMDRKKEEKDDSLRHNSRLERSRKLIHQQETLMRNLTSMRRNMDNADAYTNVSRIKY